MDAPEPKSESTSDSTVISSGEPKGKTSRKPKPKAASEPKGKRSLNLSISVEDYERFLIHAMRLTNGNISELVCKLGREHLREFHLTRTATRPTEGV